MKKSSPTTNWRFALPLALLALAAGCFLWPQQSRFLSTDDVPSAVAVADDEVEGGRTRMLNTEVVLMRRARNVGENLDDQEFRDEMLDRDSELIAARERALTSRRGKTNPEATQVWFAKRAASLKEAMALDGGDPNNARSVVTSAKLALQQMQEDGP